MLATGVEWAAFAMERGICNRVFIFNVGGYHNDADDLFLRRRIVVNKDDLYVNLGISLGIDYTVAT